MPKPAETESLIRYPCAFPIKVLGARVDALLPAVTQIARQFDPSLLADTIELRQSKSGNYLSITLSVTATSRAQLDELYRTLCAHALVKLVL